MEKILLVCVAFMLMVSPAFAEGSTSIDIKNDSSLGDSSLVSSWLSDESGLWNDLVTSTGNNLTSNNETILTTGLQGNAAAFDGLDDSLQIRDEDQVGLDFSNGNDMSWNFWVYKKDDGEDLVISKWNHVDATQYMIVVNTGPDFGYAQIYMGENPSGFGYKNVGTPVDVKYVNNNQWHMISVAYDASASNVEIWIDGISRVSGNGNGISTSIPDTDVRLMFAGRDSGGGAYSGSLNQPTAWSKVLTQSDVDKLWNSGSGVPFEAEMSEEHIVNPLILQYAPKLAMHEDEDYLPMDVEAFVEGSALWDAGGFGAGDDLKLQDASELTFAEFETIVGDGGTEDYYLAYSDPDTAASVDLPTAKVKYDSGLATNTVYYRKMDDGDYTVLQYWYFYAMNNWYEHDGFNNHEGDWESVFVFLDKETEEPKYVAYSAHHNDGFAEDNFGQYGSVRREWGSDEIEKEGDQVTSYVSLGSHANYPNNNNGVHRTSTKSDRTSEDGMILDGTGFLPGNEMKVMNPFWMEYEGSWGADVIDIVSMSSGPRGPKYSTVSGHKRFSQPVEWAGINLIEVIAFLENQLEVLFEKTGISMTFSDFVPEGSEISIAPYLEWIGYGDVEGDAILLPGFWDITSDLLNGEFEAEVTFPYDPAVLAEMGGEAQRLSVYFYNTVADVWEKQESAVDVLAHTVSFRTDHFSRYAIGYTQTQELSLEDLFDRLVGEIDETDLRSHKKKSLKRFVRLVERFALRDEEYAKHVAQRLLRHVERRVTRYEDKEYISEEDEETILETIEEIKTILDA